jgi:hypothetical protein
LVPQNVVVSDGSFSEEEIQQLIQKIAKEYETEHKQWETQQQVLQQKELKKYENKDIKQALKVINSNIDRIDQMLLIGKSILSSDEVRILIALSNELKKIRLGTNFNKMAQLLLEAQSHINKAEDAVFAALDDKKFLIDRNSVITNIDVISQYATLIRAEEKFVLKKSLSTAESLYVSGKQAAIFSVFFRKDFRQQFTSLTFLLPNTLSLLEYLVLRIIVILSGVWVVATVLGNESDLLYYLSVF